MLAFLIILPLILIYAVFILWAERKVAAFVQDRMGPMEVGYYGLGQSFADLFKLIQKEDIVPVGADRTLFKFAPIVIFTSIFAGFATLPISTDIIGSKLNVGVFYILTIISLDVVGLIMAGWGSGSKYPLFGALRAVSQIVSYEIPLTMSVLCVVMICQSLDLQEISLQQGIWINNVTGFASEKNYLFGIKSWGIELTEVGGFLTWNIFRSPVLFFAFVIFFISSLAEANRAPFDIPEAESELVSGFHTEYSGFRFAILFLGEYAMMLLLCFLASILFLGSWNTPLPNIGPAMLADWTSGQPGTISGNVWGCFWLFSKALILLFVQILARWTYPRLRVDQLMYLCWKVLIPASLILIFACGVWRLWMI
jgi:NADH-quinone oxidoreductase subunit H